MRKIYLNEDNGHFYSYRSPDEINERGVNELVDFYSKGKHLKGILFCTNVQSALFSSKVWEKLYHNYDPLKGAEQDVLKWLYTWAPPEVREIDNVNQGRRWIHNLYLLEKRGIDHIALWLSRCKKYNLEGWLTMRMNDIHYNTFPEAFWHCSFWRDNPEFRRADYRYEFEWEKAFDYSHIEVRKHHLALLKELFERYDMYGIELDWMRSGLHFAPGKEEKGKINLTEFMRQVNILRRKSEKKFAHPVKIGVRIPGEIDTALKLGMDVVKWAEEKLIDRIVISSFLNLHIDFPVEVWKYALKGTNTEIGVCIDSGMKPYPEADGLNNPEEFYYAASSNALKKEADFVYLFNTCYEERRDNRKLLNILNNAGDLTTINKKNIRYPVTYLDFVAPGDHSTKVLPVSLRPGKMGRSFKRMAQTITFRIYTGTEVKKKDKVFLILGFSRNTQYISSIPFRVYINANPLKRKGENIPLIFPEDVKQKISFSVPSEILNDGYNIVEIIPPDTDGEIVWCEIYIKRNK